MPGENSTEVNWLPGNVSSDGSVGGLASRAPTQASVPGDMPKVEVIAVEPGDLIVVTGTKPVSREEYNRVRENVREAMVQGGSAVVLGDGLSIYVSRSRPWEGQRVTPSTTGVTDDSSISPGLDPGDA